MERPTPSSPSPRSSNSFRLSSGGLPGSRETSNDGAGGPDSRDARVPDASYSAGEQYTFVSVYRFLRLGRKKEKRGVIGAELARKVAINSEGESVLVTGQKLEDTMQKQLKFNISAVDEDDVEMVTNIEISEEDVDWALQDLRRELAFNEMWQYIGNNGVDLHSKSQQVILLKLLRSVYRRCDPKRLFRERKRRGSLASIKNEPAPDLKPRSARMKGESHATTGYSQTTIKAQFTPQTPGTASGTMQTTAEASSPPSGTGVDTPSRLDTPASLLSPDDITTSKEKEVTEEEKKDVEDIDVILRENLYEVSSKDVKYLAAREKYFAAAPRAMHHGQMARKMREEREMKRRDATQGMTPRSKYSKQKKMKLEDVLKLFLTVDEDAMVKMKARFQELGKKGVDLVAFCTIFCEAFEKQLTGQDTINALMEVFQDIDICGNKIIHWETLLDHLVLMATQYQKIQQNGTTSGIKYLPSENVRDETPHDNKIIFIKHYDINGKNFTVLLERGSPKIKIYDTETLMVRHSIRGHQSAVLAVDYIPSQNLLASSSRDRTVAFWDLKTLQVVKQWKLEKSQICVCCVSGGQLCTADCQGLIYVWNLERGRLLHSFIQHRKPVMDMVALKSSSTSATLASCSLDGTIRFWNTQDFKEVTTFRLKEGSRGKGFGKESRGFVILAYSEENDLLASTDMSCFVWIWRISSGQMIQQLQVGLTHTRVVGINMQDPDEIIVANSNGLFKVFSPKNFTCLQRFNVYRMKSTLQCFTCDHVNGVILAACAKVHQFVSHDHIPSSNEATTPLVFAKYNHHDLTFITIANNKIKIWDALTGKLDRTYSRVTRTHSPVTAACLDEAMRRIFIGDHDGNIRIINYSNGALMRDLDSHEGEVSDIVYAKLEGQSTILSASWDMTVKKHADRNVKRSTLRQMKRHSKDVTTITVSRQLELIASGSADGTVKIYDFALAHELRLGGRENRKCGLEDVGPVTCAKFLGSHPVLLVAANYGELTLWNLRGGVCKKVCEGENFRVKEGESGWETKDGLNERKRVQWEPTEAVLCLSFDERTSTVYSGDTEGFIKSWALDAILTPSERRRSKASTLIRSRNTSFTPNPTSRSIHERSYGHIGLEASLKIHAHRGSVFGVDTFTSPLASQGTLLLSWGADFRTCIFTAAGELLGVLGEGEDLQRMDWGFSVDIVTIQEGDRKMLANTVGKIQERREALAERILQQRREEELEREELRKEMEERAKQEKIKQARQDESFLTQIQAIDPNAGTLKLSERGVDNFDRAIDLSGQGYKYSSNTTSTTTTTYSTYRMHPKSPLVSKPYLQKLLHRFQPETKPPEGKYVEVNGHIFQPAELTARAEKKCGIIRDQPLSGEKLRKSTSNGLNRGDRSPSVDYALEKLEAALDKAFASK
ncbi:hypothetical protein AAMO2058_000840100 [Amorphochlora amoebiformis]